MDGIEQFHDRNSEICSEMFKISAGEVSGTTVVDGEEFDHTEWLVEEHKHLEEKTRHLEETLSELSEFVIPKPETSEEDHT